MTISPNVFSQNNNPLAKKFKAVERREDCTEINPKLISNCTAGNLCLMQYWCKDTKTKMVSSNYAACPKLNGSCPGENAEGLDYCRDDHDSITVTHFEENGSSPRKSTPGSGDGSITK